MAITRTAMVDDDGSGTTGTILNNAWKQELYGQVDSFVGTAWVEFRPNAITDDPGTVLTTTIQVCRYRRLANNVLVWQLRMDAVTLPASTAGIWFSGTPFSTVGLNQFNPVSHASLPAYVDTFAANRFRVRKFDQTNWPAGAYFVRFMTTWEVDP
jgi:hypothetical protein